MDSNTVRFLELLDYIKTRLEAVNKALKKGSFEEKSSFYRERKELLEKRKRVFRQIEYELND